MGDCLHTWVLDRPESDTWECLDCGTEGSGYPPSGSPTSPAKTGGDDLVPVRRMRAVDFDCRPGCEHSSEIPSPPASTEVRHGE